MVRRALLAAGVAVFFYLLFRLGPAAVIGMLGRMGWETLWIALIYAVHQAVRAWALTASVVDAPPLAWREAFGIRLAGEAVQFLTFTGPFLAEPAKAWLLAARDRTAVHGFATTITEYLTYLFTGAALAIIATAWLISTGIVEGGLRTAAVVLMAIMIAFLVTSAWAISMRVHLLGAMLERVASLPLVRRRLRPDMASVHRTEDLLLGILHDRPGRFAWIATLESVSHVLHVLELYAILRALDLAAGIGIAFIIEGVTKFVAFAFFFVPGQVGASEGVYTVVFDVLGLPAAAGFTVPFIRRLRSLTVAGLGLLAMSVLTRGGDHLG